MDSFQFRNFLLYLTSIPLRWRALVFLPYYFRPYLVSFLYFWLYNEADTVLPYIVHRIYTLFYQH